MILSSEEILRKSFQNYSHINANLLHGFILEACADPRLERVEAYWRKECNISGKFRQGYPVSVKTCLFIRNLFEWFDAKRLNDCETPCSSSNHHSLTGLRSLKWETNHVAERWGMTHQEQTDTNEMSLKHQSSQQHKLANGQKYIDRPPYTI